MAKKSEIKSAIKKAVNNAKIPQNDLFRQAGIDPYTRLPIRAIGQAAYKSNVQRIIELVDQQDAVNRYKWYNLPLKMSSQEFERLLYFHPDLAFFYYEAVDEFYVMPYALEGTIDYYGRFKMIHPIPIAGTAGEDDKRYKEQKNALSMIKLNCTYDVLEDPATREDMTKRCVLIHDYTPQRSQNTLSRAELQRGLIDIMSDCIPFMRTALKNSTGVSGMRVQAEDEQSNVAVASASMDRAALTGEKFIALIGKLDFQELTGGQVARAEEFLLAMQALDNFRLSTYGIQNGGLFEKKAHVLQSEQEMNNAPTGLVYNDGLAIRQHFCDIVNSIWDLGMWCEPSESVIGMDLNGNGIVADEQDQSGSAPGEQPAGGGDDAI